MSRFQIPHWLRKALTTLAHSRFSCEAPAYSLAPVGPQAANPFEGRGALPTRNWDLGWTTIAIVRYPVKQTRTGENLYDAYQYQFQFPLSESVAPPGTAWGAEGLRGNEANENNTMVLVPARVRKSQVWPLFAQEDMAVRSRFPLWVFDCRDP